jgi:peptidoglycan biosynthesis protein MviN/MurJ (putative lipid II flippase)
MNWNNTVYLILACVVFIAMSILIVWIGVTFDNSTSDIVLSVVYALFWVVSLISLSIISFSIHQEKKRKGK